jgi:hypothetical protein
VIDKLTDKALRDYLFATNLPPVERHTLLTLAHGIIRNDPGLPLREYYLTIAQWLGVEVRTAKYRVKNLEKLGILIPTRSGGGRDQHGCGFCNEWRFDFDALKAFSTHNDQAQRSSPKGDTGHTLNDAIEQHARGQRKATRGDTERQQGGKPITERVIQIAHTPMIPMEPMTPNEDTKPARSPTECSDEFESWWKSYPSRPGCPKGIKSEAWDAWQKLSAEQHAEVLQATVNLIQSKAYPKDAQRFLRPERGSKNPEAVFQSWVKIESQRHSPNGTESAKHDEDDSWLPGDTP